MKARILLSILTLAFTVSPQTPATQTQTPLQQMVQTEQAFSRMAAEKSARDAFMAFIADDGLLFRPTAVNGKQWMREHPVPASDKNPLLAWQPAFAVMSAAGDLGFTTGPWEFKTDVKDEKPSGYGHFVTLWKKQPDGTWKFVVDLGISHPLCGGPQTLWQPPEPKPAAKIRRVDVAIARRNLINWDRDYLLVSGKHGLASAFTYYASPDVRLYRDGSLPFIGRSASAKALESAKGQVSWTTTSGDVSRSGDLGYTYGTYEVTDAAKVTERGSYVRIWRKEGSLWQIVLDVANPQQ
jgi:ketosteroid isomerase-like protein